MDRVTHILRPLLKCKNSQLSQWICIWKWRGRGMKMISKIGQSLKSSLIRVWSCRLLWKASIFRISVILTRLMRAWWSSAHMGLSVNRCPGRPRSAVYRLKSISIPLILKDYSKWSNMTFSGGPLLSVEPCPLLTSSYPSWITRIARPKQNSTTNFSKKSETNGYRKCSTQRPWSKNTTGWTSNSKNPKLS